MPRLLACLFLLFTACGCAPLTLASRWSDGPPLPPPQAPEQPGPEFALSAENDAQVLRVSLSTRNTRLKKQLLGAFHQAMVLWLRHPRDGGLGLEVAFHPKPGTGFPGRELEERKYWKAASWEFSVLEAGRQPRIVHPKDPDFQFESSLLAGELSFSFRLPMQWIPAGQGQSIEIGMECSEISWEAAQLELTREYYESVLGWGWGKDGYGPRKDPPAYGLGNVDAWGLDKGIYARQGIYRPSLESVPQPFYWWAKLKLAAKMPASEAIQRR